ncbi:MAG: glycosyltransferase family 39 protein, partial [Bacteroidota bacterium]|nr:glycosyltransferase family 39 protein [Bacteroidota bacterium]
MAKKPTAEGPLVQTQKSQDTLALAVSGIAALAYYLYSFKSTGYYQHDEIAHLINMNEFWDKPSSILGNWPKTGYKLVYAIPALLGTKFILILNCLFAGLASYLAYKTAALFDQKFALLAAILLATQPMWIEISFRNYADSFSGLILIAAVYFHYRDKWLIAGLLLSFSTLVRQEFFLVAIPYGIYLLTQRQWLAAFMMGSFPVLYDIWGAIETGDPLYLINSSKATSDLYSEQFARHGFFHFWRMSFVVWGAVTTLLAVLFSSVVIQSTVKKEVKNTFSKNPWFLLIPALVYLLIHSLFNWDALALGASPNLRYMNGIGPVLAVMAALGLSSWEKVGSQKNLHLIVLGIALGAYALFAAYGHNGVVLTEESDYSLFFFGLLAIGLLFVK